jgi:hypothetical protein
VTATPDQAAATTGQAASQGASQGAGQGAGRGDSAGPMRVVASGPGGMKFAGSGQGPKVAMGGPAAQAPAPADTGTAPGIMKLANSFIDAQALLTGIELGLFTALAAGPASEQEIRVQLALHGRGLQDWLELLAELGLLRREDGLYRNGPGASSYLVEGVGYYMGEHLLQSCRKLYPAWARLGDALRSGQQQSQASFQQALADPALLVQFVTSMDELTGQFAPQLVEAYDGWPGHQTLLDVGGCRGTVAAQLVAAHPGLAATVFDLPQLEPLFEANIAARGLAGRLTFQPGSFFTDDLPAADVIVIGHVLHDWAQDQRKLLVTKAARSLAPGGALLVYDRMTDDSQPGGRNLRGSLNMLLMTESGAEYPLAELRRNAEQAGLTPVDHRQLGRFDTLLIARKPA